MNKLNTDLSNSREIIDASIRDQITTLMSFYVEDCKLSKEILSQGGGIEFKNGDIKDKWDFIFMNRKFIETRIAEKRDVESGGAVYNVLYDNAGMLSNHMSNIDLYNIKINHRIITLKNQSYRSGGDYIPMTTSFALCTLGGDSIGVTSYINIKDLYRVFDYYTRDGVLDEWCYEQFINKAMMSLDKFSTSIVGSGDIHESLIQVFKKFLNSGTVGIKPQFQLLNGLIDYDTLSDTSPIDNILFGAAGLSSIIMKIIGGIIGGDMTLHSRDSRPIHILDILSINSICHTFDTDGRDDEVPNESISNLRNAYMNIIISRAILTYVKTISNQGKGSITLAEYRYIKTYLTIADNAYKTFIDLSQQLADCDKGRLLLDLFELHDLRITARGGKGLDYDKRTIYGNGVARDYSPAPVSVMGNESIHQEVDELDTKDIMDAISNEDIAYLARTMPKISINSTNLKRFEDKASILSELAADTGLESVGLEAIELSKALVEYSERKFITDEERVSVRSVLESMVTDYN